MSKKLYIRKKWEIFWKFLFSVSQERKKILVFYTTLSSLGVFLTLITRKFDQPIFEYFQQNRSPVFDKISIFLTEYFLILVLILIGASSIFHFFRRKNILQWIFTSFSVLFAGIFGYILKAFFKIPRPYILHEISPLIPTDNFWSFPSLHATLSFAPVLCLLRISKKLGFTWLFFAVLIAFSRVYQEVHFLSDIVAGAFFGGIFAGFFTTPRVEEWFLNQWESSLEFRRQLFHFSAGFLVVFLHWTQFFPEYLVILVLLFGLLISFISLWHKIPFFSALLQNFERPRDSHFPGKGFIFFYTGVLLSFLFFPTKIAYASVLILSIGDSVNHLLASRIFPTRVPWNPRKTFFGMIAGVVLGTLAAQFFVPLWAAFIASLVALFLETFITKFRNDFLDDNLFIPLISGGILMLLL